MSRLKQNIKIIIFGTETRTGKLFDEILIIAIILSIVTVLLDSVSEYRQQYGQLLNFAEWIFTIMFTIEYSMRIYCIKRPLSYVTWCPPRYASGNRLTNTPSSSAINLTRTQLKPKDW